MYLNVINYIVHVEHHVGCTVFVIDLQQAEVTNRVSDFYFLVTYTDKFNATKDRIRQNDEYNLSSR